MKHLPKFLLLVGGGLLAYGLLTGGFGFVWSRAVSLCLSCMGLE
ncbi:thioredoxin [Thermodesulfatator indicus]|nr:thioredoxin [Thermodesulfatator indicus]